MEIVKIFSESIKYPIKKDSLKVIALFLIMVIPLVAVLYIPTLHSGAIPKSIRPLYQAFLIWMLIASIIISLIMGGYSVSVMREGIKRSDSIPSFQIKKNIVDSIKVWVLSFVYYIIPTIIIYILMFAVIGVGNSSRSIFSDAFTIVMIISIIIELIFSLLLIVGILRFAKYDSMSEGLSFSKIWDDLSQIGIMKFIVVYICLAIILGVILFICVLLFTMPITAYLAFIIIPLIIVPYISLFVPYGFGLLYSDVE